LRACLLFSKDSERFVVRRGERFVLYQHHSYADRNLRHNMPESINILPFGIKALYFEWPIN
jgi:hypothetical protein